MKKRNTNKRWLATAVAAAITAATLTATATMTHAEDTEVAEKSRTSYEDIAWDSPRYFTNSDGVVFKFYEIYDIEDGEELDYHIVGRELSKGIFAEVYEDEEKPFYVQDFNKLNEWDKEGTFIYNGEQYNYNLVCPSKLTRDHRILLENMIVHKVQTNPQRVSYFDYSKDGVIRINDLILLNRQLAATPMSSITNCDPVFYEQMTEEQFFEILDFWYNRGRKQIYVRFGDTLPSEEELKWMEGN